MVRLHSRASEGHLRDLTKIEFIEFVRLTGSTGRRVWHAEHGFGTTERAIVEKRNQISLTVRFDTKDRPITVYRQSVIFVDRKKRKAQKKTVQCS